MTISRRLFLAGSAAATAASAKESLKMPNGYDWTYDNANIIDPPLEVLMGSASDLTTWIANNKASLHYGFNNVPVPSITSVYDGGWKTRPEGYDLLQVIANYPTGSVVYDGGGLSSYIGAFIGRPAVVDPSKPLIIALHGHEIAHRGDPPSHLWTEHWWPEALCQAGYVVITPGNLFYKQFPSLYGSWDYHVIWTRAVWDLINACLSTPAGFPAFTGKVACGLSTGGTIATWIMGWKPEIQKGVFAGSLCPLEFLRQNCRMTTYPNSWDLRNVYSYMPYYMLCADRRVQWQLGKQDSIYPDHTAWVGDGTTFLGTDRDVMASEIMGDFLPARDAAQKLGGSAELHLHTDGHVLKPDAALAFFAS